VPTKVAKYSSLSWKLILLSTILQEPSRRPVPGFEYTSSDVADKPLVSIPTKDVLFCPCDGNNVCFEQSRVGLTPTNRVIRICLQSDPSDSKLIAGPMSAIHIQASLPDPTFEVQVDAVNENKAVVTTELQPEYFDEDLPSEITVYGTTTILASGARSRGYAAFFVIYDLLSSTDTPTLSPSSTFELSLGAKVCYCEKDSAICLEDTPNLSPVSRSIQICIL
jgi:hypothetical protein